MTRETKVGLIVAFSFLLLVGSVVFFKLYIADPAGEDGGEQASAKVDAGPKPSPTPKSTGVTESPTTKPTGLDVAPSDVAGNTASPPDPVEPERPATPVVAGPGLTGRPGRPDSRPPALPPGLQSEPGPLAKPGSGTGRPDFGSPAERPGPALGSAGGFPSGDRPGSESPPPPPPEEPEKKTAPPAPDLPPLPNDPERVTTRPGQDVKPGSDARPSFTGRPANASIEERPAADTGSRPGFGGGLPALEGPGADARARPGSESTSKPGAAAPLDLPGAEDARGATGGGSSSSPSSRGEAAPGASREEPTPRRDSPVPLALPPEARTGDTPARVPMPENPPTPGASSLRPDAFDRRYDPIGTPAQLGKPMPEAVKEDLSRAHPVEIRPQPEVDAAPGASASRGSGNVLIYDREVYTLRPGDSYATISNAKYGSPRYAEALALYNREQNPRLSTPVAGQSVFVPPVDILERKYGSAITGERGSSEAGRRDMATAFQPREARPGPGATSPERSFPANGLNDKRYRVRTGDTLWNIAKQTLGQGERWTEIMRMNRDVLPDINRLHDGLMLRLPVDAKVDSPPPSQ